MKIIVNGFLDYSMTHEEFYHRILHSDHKGANASCPVTLEHNGIELQLSAEDWAKAKFLLNEMTYC